VGRKLIEHKLVDYKKDVYRLSLGEDYKVSRQIIHWRWAAEDDPDGKIDSTGTDAFMYLGEPLIHYNGAEYLPSLHIETNKNLITSFICSVLFNLETDRNAIDKFLGLMSGSISALKVDSVVSSIKTKGVYTHSSNEIVETYSLTKAEGYGSDEFKYTIYTTSARVTPHWHMRSITR
jgi:hypothetical protein